MVMGGANEFSGSSIPAFMSYFYTTLVNNAVRGEVLGIATCLRTVDRRNKGHASCKIRWLHTVFCVR